MNTETTVSTSIPSQHIAVEAYHIWINEGRPLGRDQEFWLRAESQLRQGQRTATPSTKAAKPAPAPVAPAPEKTVKPAFATAISAPEKAAKPAGAPVVPATVISKTKPTRRAQV